MALAETVLGPTLPGLAQQVHADLSRISLLFVSQSVGYMVGSFQGGRLYDRMRGHPVMAAALLTIAATMGLMPLMFHLWLLILMMFMMGLGVGMLEVGGNTLLVWVHKEKVGPFVNGLYFFWGSGAFLSPIIVARIVLVSGGIAWAYWVLALLIGPATLWLLLLPSPVPQAAPETETPVSLDYRLIGLVAFLFFLYAGILLSFSGWLFTYTLAMGLAGEAVAAYLTSAFWAALILGRLAAIPLAARFRPRYILLVDLLGCLVSVSLFLVWPYSLSVAWVGAFGLGLSLASFLPTIFALVERRMTLTGRVTSYFFIGASIGGIIQPWLVGYLFERIGPPMTMWVVFVSVILGLAAFSRLVRFDPKN